MPSPRSKSRGVAHDINHLDFSLVCNCNEHREVRGAKLFGLVPAKHALVPCGQVASYFGVSRCCGENVYLCREHREDDWCWMCPQCQRISLSLASGLTIYPLRVDSAPE